MTPFEHDKLLTKCQILEKKAEFLGNGLDTGPVDEFPLDLLPVLIGTDLAVAPVATMSLLPCCPSGSFQLRAKLALRSVFGPARLE